MYIFLQQYWWLVVSLLGAILVFLLFVQGGNSLLFCLGKTEEHRKMMVNSTGRKWEFTFTTLVTFGGAFLVSIIAAVFDFTIQDNKFCSPPVGSGGFGMYAYTELSVLGECR